MHQSIPQVGSLHEEPHSMVSLAHLVEDVMCVVKSDTEWLTAQSKVTKLYVVGHTTDEDQEHVLMAGILKKYDKLKGNTWLCDSGATCHLMNDSPGLYDIIEINEMVIISDGNGLKIIKKGKLTVKVVQNDGSRCDLMLGEGHT